MNRRWTIVLTALLLAAAARVRAGTEPEGEDPIAKRVFPPDVVLGHQQEIGLDETQRQSLRSEMHKAQKKFVDFQFELQGETERMLQLLEERPVDESRVLAQADRILALEKEIKKTHLTLLVRVKNLLTREQQAKLSEIRRSSEK
jgi:Spy/CpxP family protein refolding chaperone